MNLNEQLIREYAKKISGFAWSKTRHPQDAEDLAQDIMLVLCQHDFAANPIQNMDAYIYQICRYTYANFVRARVRDRDHTAVVTSEQIMAIPSEEDIPTEVANTELYARLRREVAYLGRMRRQITVMTYYEGKNSREIGTILGISDATVRWYLSDTQKKLKERMDMKESIYSPKHLNVYISGYSPDLSLRGLRDDLLTQNICLVCACERGMTVDEIAAAMNMSAAFIEDKIPTLLDMVYLEEVGKSRYRTTFLIQNGAYELAKIRYQMKTLPPIARIIYEKVKAKLPVIREIGFEGCDLGENFLLWYLVTFAAHIYECHPPFEEKYEQTMRGDGGRFAVDAAYSDADTLREGDFTAEEADYLTHYRGMAGKHNGNGRITIQQFDPPVCGGDRPMIPVGNIGYWERLHDLTKEGAVPTEPDKDIIAHAVREGYAEMKDGQPRLSVPYFTADQIDKLYNLLRQTVFEEIAPAVGEHPAVGYAKLVAALIPDYLSDNERKFHAHHRFYQPNAYTYLLLKEGLLSMPTEDEQKRICTAVWENAK